MWSDEVSTSASPLVRPFSELVLVGSSVLAPSSTRKNRGERFLNDDLPSLGGPYIAQDGTNLA